MKKIATALLLSSVAAAPALAADEGFYLGANITTSSTNYAGGKSPAGFSIDAGYQFMKYFAIEGLYGDFGDIGPTFSNKPTAWSIAAKGIYPFNDQWSIDGKLGVAKVDTKTSGSGIIFAGSPLDGTYSKTAVTFGIGGQFNFAPGWGARASWDRYKTGGSQGIWTLVDGNLDVFSLGVNYKF